MDKILITGIGGNVGYGILRNCRTYFPNIKIIGTNTKRISAGNHLCNEVYEVPFSLDPDYIQTIKKICDINNISLIIPSTDYESWILTSNSQNLPPIAASPANTCKIFLDKYLTYSTLNEHGILFAESILPSNYKNEFQQFIVKPREGRGSRGLYINPQFPKQFSDENIIQPLLSGKEITTAFYITKNNNIHGLITLERQLADGATNICEVVTTYDEKIFEYISFLIQKINIKGSCNIQSIVNEKGFIPFEINCRISGTNSIRSQFGFKDVAYTINEYLYNMPLEEVKILKGTAIRILHDIIYPNITMDKVNNNLDNFYIYE